MAAASEGILPGGAVAVNSCANVDGDEMSGGALFLSTSSASRGVQVLNCTFATNAVWAHKLGQGGAVAMSQCSSPVNITLCYFVGNIGSVCAN